jgi:hypothetical protein
MAATSVACGPGKRAQCQDIGNATNQVMNEVMDVHQNQIGHSAYDPAFETSLAAAWESGVGMMNGLDLPDKELRDMRDRLAIAYQQAADTHRQVATLIPEDGRLDPALEQQVDALQSEAEAGIPPVISELNLYCIGG